jgi:hypothetical protein
MYYHPEEITHVSIGLPRLNPHGRRKKHQYEKELTKKTYTRCSTHLCESYVFTVVDDPTEAKVRDEQLRILGFGAEEEVFRLQIAVHDALVVYVFDSTENGAYELCCITDIVGVHTNGRVIEYERVVMSEVETYQKREQ